MTRPSRHSCRAPHVPEEHRVQRPNDEQLGAIRRGNPREHVEELPLERGERDEFLGRAGVRRVEDKAVLPQEGMPGSMDPTVVQGREAVHPLAVGQPRGLPAGNAAMRSWRTTAQRLVPENSSRSASAQKASKKGSMCAGNGDAGSGKETCA
jgi:hypothetical protein